MQTIVRAYQEQDLHAMAEIWNEVVEAGTAFPQINPLSLAQAKDFFASQSFTAVAEREGRVVGLYILHPNNVGRCAHLANASYAVQSSARGDKVGEALVRHSLTQAKALGFGVLQFNAVVKTNRSAIHLYNKLGFVQLGTVPKGFLAKDGHYEDIVLFYHTLENIQAC